jgi:cytosine/adenosine deaminase-related metal-dependent hydrolase
MLPSVESMYRHGLKLTLGTDSLASNTELSLVAELRILARAFPEIPFSDMLTWATVNGAEFLGLPNEQVTIREGQKCTLVNVIGVNPDAPHWSQAINSERLQ